MEEENKFLRSLYREKGHKKLNVQLVDALMERVEAFPEGEIAMGFCFGKILYNDASYLILPDLVKQCLHSRSIHGCSRIAVVIKFTVFILC